jgi:hypothetical protein
MHVDAETYKDHMIANFIDPATVQWICFRSAVENNSIPLGNDCYYALRLGSDGSAELAIKEYHGYTFEQEAHLVVRGRWKLYNLWEDRFAIQFIDPVFEIVQVGLDVSSYIERFRTGQPWMVSSEQV